MTSESVTDRTKTYRSEEVPMIHDLETGRARRAVVRVAMVAALALTPVGGGAGGGGGGGGAYR
ncbi:hypothetical protein [Nocardia abscessus]|uniref:hypothetical protein n=1 Tax=Nocardia abscessus TaxID=120957 RepID=UPI00245520CA|nr:hypothetical protein [Nocardia abscessus]